MGNATSRSSRSQPVNIKESPAYLFLEEELQEKVQEHGWHHEAVAEVCHRQGELLDAKGSCTDAVDKFLEALDIRKKVMGDQHAVIGETYYSIACAMAHQGNHVQAVGFFHQAIRIQKLAFGIHSKQVGNSKNNMGKSQCQQEKYDDALVSLWSALRIREKLENDNKENNDAADNCNIDRDSGVAETLFNIGRVHHAKGDIQEGLSWYEKSLKNALDNGDSTRALLAVEEALPLMIVLHGRDTKTVATLLLQQGVLLDAAGRYQEAMESFSAALDIRQAKLSKTHPAVAETLYIMGCTYVQLDSYEEAVKCFEKAAIIQKKRCGLDSKELGDSKNMLGYCQYKLGKLDDALASLSDALGIRKLRDDPDGVSKTLATIKSAQKIARTQVPARRRRPKVIEKTLSGSSSSSGSWRDLSPIREQGESRASSPEPQFTDDDDINVDNDRNSLPAILTITEPQLTRTITPELTPEPNSPEREQRPTVDTSTTTTADPVPEPTTKSPPEPTTTSEPEQTQTEEPTPPQPEQTQTKDSTTNPAETPSEDTAAAKPTPEPTTVKQEQSPIEENPKPAPTLEPRQTLNEEVVAAESSTEKSPIEETETVSTPEPTKTPEPEASQTPTEGASQEPNLEPTIEKSTGEETTADALPSPLAPPPIVQEPPTPAPSLAKPVPIKADDNRKKNGREATPATAKKATTPAPATEKEISEEDAELLAIDFDRDGEDLREAIAGDVLAMWDEQGLYNDMPDLRNELLKGIVEQKFQELRDEQVKILARQKQFDGTPKLAAAEPALSEEKVSP